MRNTPFPTYCSIAAIEIFQQYSHIVFIFRFCLQSALNNSSYLNSSNKEESSM